MDIQVAVARPDQYDAVGAVTVAAYRGIHPVEHLAHFDDFYEHELEDVVRRASDADVLVAVDADGTVLGGVSYVPGPTSSWAEFSDADAAGVRMLAVSPDAQGRGVGATLLQACIDRAADAGRRQIVLHSTDWMTGAHRLYERYGFARDATIDWEPSPGLWLRGFRLALPKR